MYLCSVLTNHFAKTMREKIYLTILLALTAIYLRAQITPLAQMEKLDRGVVALPLYTSGGNFVSWRFLGTDANDTRFDLMRNGTTIATDLEVTNYRDAAGNKTSEYQVVTKVNGQIVSTSNPVKPWTQFYKPLKLDRPATGALGGTYSPNDCSVGDVDSDGEYEIFVKWDPDCILNHVPCQHDCSLVDKHSPILQHSFVPYASRALPVDL